VYLFHLTFNDHLVHLSPDAMSAKWTIQIMRIIGQLRLILMDMDHRLMTYTTQLIPKKISNILHCGSSSMLKYITTFPLGASLGTPYYFPRYMIGASFSWEIIWFIFLDNIFIGWLEMAIRWLNELLNECFNISF
jgi:hypothetical protein